MRNSADSIYPNSGDALLLKVTEDGRGGYAATFDSGMQLA